MPENVKPLTGSVQDDNEDILNMLSDADAVLHLLQVNDG